MVKILSFLFCFLLFACAGADKENAQVSPLESLTVKDGQVYYYLWHAEKNFKVMFLADTHFTIEDERGKDFYSFTQRMGGSAVEPENYGKSNRREQALLESLKEAKKAGCELVILGGDIINFPSLASVELLEQIMKESGLKWIYTAGNHDWHYEGEQGDAAVLRDKWEQSNLKKLYQGQHPLYSSTVLHGINFVLIDNSTNEVTKEQLDFMQEQIEKGLPIILSMHIPLYLPGHNIDYGCGNPQWNKKNDPYYEIEKRLPWPEEGHTHVTYAFRDLIFHCPLILGVYAGHTHEEAWDVSNNVFQYVAGANYNNEFFMMNFVDANSAGQR
ncbi:MAG: metallophosphoesterase [Phocaeicola sp.]|nr:metallophosphoesterase [Phocaeicola sp.]